MTARRPEAVAFDVVETLFSLAPVEEALRPLGVPLSLFFTRFLRDGFALVVTGDRQMFPAVASSVLRTLAPGSDDRDRRAVLDAFADLPAHPDAAPAIEHLVAAGLRVVTLTNGGADKTGRLIARARLDRHIEQVISVDEVGRWKPAPEPYLYMAHRMGCDPAEMALVAAHDWDVHGAKRAGLVTGWCSRSGQSFPDVFAPPDISGPDLVAVADGLLRLPG